MNTIGRYQLVEKLGQGGMGVVYRAFDPLLQRVVAIKLISTLDADEELRERFFREARAAGQLSHKNIITIHDLGEYQGQPFLAMEYLEGQDLQQRIASGTPMTLARKLELAVEICEGIAYAHQHGVIHRDIKPANIFLTNSGTAKILDFGLARLITSELTNSNMMMGTLNYMAPEQVRGERADHRSDIFSTGVVLYEVFAGRRAFEGDSFGATLYKILDEVPVPLRQIDASLPAELDAIVDRAMAKPREARYPQMSEMLADLAGYRQQLVITNSPPYGGVRTEVIRVPSDAPRLTPRDPVRTPGSGVPIIAHDAPTIAAPTPLPALSTVGGAPVSGSAQAPRASRQTAVLAVASLLLIAVIAIGALWSRDGDAVDTPPAAPAVSPPAAPAIATQQAIASRLEQASQALQAGDRASAQRHADAVLAMSPGHAEARRLRDRAVQAGEAAGRGLANARDLLEAGRYDDAARAAGEVLTLDPGNTDAKRVMDEAAARSRGRGADEARGRMNGAKNAAIAAAATKLAAAPYAAALSAEREASALVRRGRTAEATAKFWEASGLFRSAEVAAQTEAAARAERARVTRAEAGPPPPAAEPAPSAPKAAPPPPVLPAPPVPTTTGLPGTVASPVPPPSAPPPPAAPATEPISPTAAIAELLDRYETALEGRNLEALKRIWPSLSGAQESAIRSEFQNASRIDVEMQSPQINVAGTTATVQCVRRYQLHTADGQRLRNDTRTTITLQRNGQTWIITQIRFEAMR